MNVRTTDLNQSPEEFRVNSFLSNMRDINFGNCGVPTELQEYLIRDKRGIEDIFLGNDCVYILPRSRETAKYLLDVCLGEPDEYGHPDALADEIEWVKLGDRYYLNLWWD